MDYIYVIIGTTGEYSDRKEWTVIAYRDEIKAQEHVVNATRRAAEIFVMKQKEEDIRIAILEKYRFSGQRKIAQLPVIKNVNEFDPGMQMEYTGVSYYIAKTPLADGNCDVMPITETSSYYYE